MALVLSVALQGLEGSGGRVEWPPMLSWLGASPFASDGLSGGLGAWCLLLGMLCLLKIGSGENAPLRLSVAMLAIATLYALVHTVNFLAFGVMVFALALLTWGYFVVSGEQDARTDRSTLSLGLGSLFLIGASLLIGRQTGGDYDLGDLSLSTLTVWPLVLFAAYTIAWLGLVPLTGWSALVPSGGFRTLLHSLILGVPVVTLALRLQSLVTVEAIGATIPANWGAFMQALGWLGCITSVVSAAAMLVWAGKSRWPALQATFWLGLALWALSLDTPLARYSGVVIVLAYGAGRVALELLPPGNDRFTSFLRIFANASLAGVPVTPGFVGVWLFAHALAEEVRPALALIVLGAVVLAACGTVLHTGNRGEALAGDAMSSRYAGWAGVLSVSLLVVVMLLIPLWSPYVEGVTTVAGGVPRLEDSWVGVSSGGGTLAVTLLVAGAILLAGLGWLVATSARAGSGVTGVLLPTALERLDKRRNDAESGQGDPDISPLLENSPAPVWWASMAWLDRGVWGFGSVLARLTSRFGGLLGRLEGRFYLPLALILTLAALLAVTR